MKNHVIGQHMNQWKTFSWNVSLQGRLDDVSDESRREEAVEYVFANLLLKAMNYQKGRTLVTSAPRWPQAYACTRPYHPRRYFILSPPTDRPHQLITSKERVLSPGLHGTLDRKLKSSVSPRQTFGENSHNFQLLRHFCHDIVLNWSGLTTRLC